jgi:hypothetical protein
MKTENEKITPLKNTEDYEKLKTDYQAEIDKYKEQVEK